MSFSIDKRMVLVLSDLSSAFHPVNHEILFPTGKKCLVCQVLLLNDVNLKARSQIVLVMDVLSDVPCVLFGDPQSSVPGHRHRC